MRDVKQETDVRLKSITFSRANITYLLYRNMRLFSQQTLLFTSRQSYAKTHKQKRSEISFMFLISRSGSSEDSIISQPVSHTHTHRRTYVLSLCERVAVGWFTDRGINPQTINPVTLQVFLNENITVTHTRV